MELDFECLTCGNGFTDDVEEDELGYVEEIDVDCPKCGSSNVVVV